MSLQDIEVSILMPVKNGAQYLESCLNSILAQSFVNWELLVVNDHSIDDTEKILSFYAQNDSRIKPFLNRGRGIIPALQLAYSKSKGSYITRMDADDIMVALKLQSLKTELSDVGKGHIATALVKYFSDDVLGEGYQKYEQWINNLTRENKNYTEIYKECPIASPCWMLHREDLDRINAFNTDVYPEDYDLIFRCYKNRIAPVGINEVMHLWRDYPTRTSRIDKNYSDNRFSEIKVDYFVQCDWDGNKELFLWGAGNRAKKIAQLLTLRNIAFRWISNNEKKVGQNIYGVIIESDSVIHKEVDFQIIVLVSNPKEQKLITTELVKLGLTVSIDYFFFC